MSILTWLLTQLVLNHSWHVSSPVSGSIVSVVFVKYWMAGSHVSGYKITLQSDLLCMSPPPQSGTLNYHYCSIKNKINTNTQPMASTMKRTVWRACKKQRGEGEKNAREGNLRHWEAGQEANPTGLHREWSLVFGEQQGQKRIWRVQ